MVRARRGLAVALAAGAVVVAVASMASADAGAQGVAAYSPGVGSGNLIQVPIHIPVNACGNTISVIGLLNPSFGNTCINA
ncbi:chaplin [Streptomyces erythrochromogenes]|uniref:chaplin n=1 Tax=Streptomyces erythrochromogenes TaxID=285574 RepID=UPI00368ECC94